MDRHPIKRLKRWLRPSPSTFSSAKMLWPTKEGPRIDMWKIDGEKHIFGYWENGSLAGPDCPPKSTLPLPIRKNGNYPGNPSPKNFYSWLSTTLYTPVLFSEAAYKDTFGWC